MHWSLLATFAAMIATLAGNLLPASGWSTAVRYAGLGYLLGSFVVRVSLGIRRRLPYWTAESWRSFLLVAAIPVTALIAGFVMLVALEYRLPIVGGPGSVARGVVIVLSMMCLLVGAIGLAWVVSWLAEGDPTRQFTWPRRRDTSSAAS